jgi:hypothetical protein
VFQTMTRTSRNTCDPVQGKSSGELEGVTFVAHTELGAAANAPSVHMHLTFNALTVIDADVRARGAALEPGMNLPLLHLWHSLLMAIALHQVGSGSVVDWV